MTGFQICDLADRPQHIAAVSQWMWDEWDKSRGLTLAQSIKETENWCQRNAVPWGIVAVDGERLLGVMCLLAYDYLDEHPDLTPWMACQYVLPEARGGGVAATLSAALEQRAQDLGFKKLYMWTEHNPKIYTRYGYKPLFSTQWYGRPIVVLAKDMPEKSA